MPKDLNPSPTTTPDPEFMAMEKSLEKQKTAALAGPRKTVDNPPQQPQPPVQQFFPRQNDLPALPKKQRYDDEDDDYDDRRGGRGLGCGCLFWFLNCRTIGCGCSLLLLAAIVGTIYLIIAKPPQVWEPLKEWLNADLETIVYDGRTLESVKAQLNQELSSFTSGENKLIVTEQQIYPLVQDRLSALGVETVYVDLQPNLFKLFWNGDNSSPAKPLWLVLEATPGVNGQLQIDKIGTERVPLPEALNGTATNALLSGIRVLQGASSTADLLRIIFPFKENIEINGVTIERDQMTITLNVKTGLENFF